MAYYYPDSYRSRRDSDRSNDRGYLEQLLDFFERATHEVRSWLSEDDRSRSNSRYSNPDRITRRYATDRYGDDYSYSGERRRDREFREHPDRYNSLRRDDRLRDQRSYVDDRRFPNPYRSEGRYDRESTDWRKTASREYTDEDRRSYERRNNDRPRERGYREDDDYGRYGTSYRSSDRTRGSMNRPRDDARYPDNRDADNYSRRYERYGNADVNTGNPGRPYVATDGRLNSNRN
jgi:hypothetical protein